MRRGEKLRVVDHDPKWADIFKKLKDIYLEHLKDWVVEVEHVGSTAVPDLCAKPCIDIDIVIEDYSSFPDVKRKLSELGYDYEGDLGIEGREAFKRKDKNVPWDGSGSEKYDHNLYVCPENSRELERHLELRDHLRDDQKSRKRYGRLKRRLAKEHKDDIVAYTEGKTKFIERILERET